MNDNDRARLILDARECRACERMSHSRRVLTDLNGCWNAEVLFVAEAPGRLGAEVSGIPLCGDRTGDRFQELIAHIGWNRESLFITNAVLCNPRDDKGNNDTPNRKEVHNCSQLLRRTIMQVNPRLVVALGRVALESLSLLDSHGRGLRQHAGTTTAWYGRTLAVLYHPGPRSVVHRPWGQQLRDAEKVAEYAENSLAIRRGDA